MKVRQVGGSRRLRVVLDGGETGLVARTSDSCRKGRRYRTAACERGGGSGVHDQVLDQPVQRVQADERAGGGSAGRGERIDGDV